MKPSSVLLIGALLVLSVILSAFLAAKAPKMPEAIEAPLIGDISPETVDPLCFDPEYGVWVNCDYLVTLGGKG